MSYRIAAECYADGWEFDVVPSAGPTVTITIPDGTYYILGDGAADDLLKVINDLCTAAAVAVSFAFVDGFIRVTIGAGVTGIDLTPSSALRFALGFRAQLTPLASTTADYHSLFTFDGRGLAVEEIEEPTALASKAMTDTRTYTSHYGQTRRRKVRFYFEGNPRSTDSAEEYYGLRSLWEEALSKGNRFRYYPDTSTSTSAYNEVLPDAEPYGYQVYTHESPANFNGSPLVSGWYDQWQIDATWRLEE